LEGEHHAHKHRKPDRVFKSVRFYFIAHNGKGLSLNNSAEKTSRRPQAALVEHSTLYFYFFGAGDGTGIRALEGACSGAGATGGFRPGQLSIYFLDLNKFPFRLPRDVAG